MGKFVDGLNLPSVLQEEQQQMVNPLERSVAADQVALITVPTECTWNSSREYTEKAIAALKRGLSLQVQSHKLYQAILSSEGFGYSDYQSAESFQQVMDNTCAIDLSAFRQKIRLADGTLAPSPLPALLRMFEPAREYNYWFSSATGSQQERNPSMVHRTRLGTLIMLGAYLDGLEHQCERSSHGQKQFDHLVMFAPDPGEPNVQGMLKHSHFSLVCKHAECMGRRIYYALDFSGPPQTWGRVNADLCEHVFEEANQKGESVALAASPIGMHMALGEVRARRGMGHAYKRIPYIGVFDGGGGLESGRKGAVSMSQRVSLTDFADQILGLFPSGQLQDIGSLYGTSEVCFLAMADYTRLPDGQVLKIFQNPGFTSTAVMDVDSSELREKGQGLLCVLTALNGDNAGANFAWTTDLVEMFDRHPVTGAVGTYWRYMGRANDLLPDLGERKPGCGMNYIQLAEQEGLVEPEKVELTR